jgi:phage terminase small subunit
MPKRERKTLDSAASRRERFAREYLIDQHPGRAAERAGLVKPGSTPAQSSAAGRRLLAEPQVVARVEQLQAEQYVRTKITADFVLREMARLAFANLQDLYDENGALLPVSQLPRDLAAALTSVKVKTLAVEGTEVDSEAPASVLSTVEVKLADKRAALAELGKYLKLFDERRTHSFDLSGLSDEQLKAIIDGRSAV